MPVIVTASSKGGAGKSALTLVLARALDAMGASVTIMDADPNRPLVRWRAGKSTSRIEVIGEVTESNIIKLNHQADSGIQRHSTVCFGRSGGHCESVGVASNHPG
jgi:Mrp family chromosome partitioning ATPase